MINESKMVVNEIRPLDVLKYTLPILAVVAHFLYLLSFNPPNRMLIMNSFTISVSVLIVYYWSFLQPYRIKKLPIGIGIVLMLVVPWFFQFSPANYFEPLSIYYYLVNSGIGCLSITLYYLRFKSKPNRDYRDVVKFIAFSLFIISIIFHPYLINLSFLLLLGAFSIDHFLRQNVFTSRSISVLLIVLSILIFFIVYAGNQIEAAENKLYNMELEYQELLESYEKMKLELEQ